MNLVFIIVMVVLIILLIYIFIRNHFYIKGGKYKYQIMKPKKYDDNTYVMPNIEILNINDDYMDLDKNINPDIFWKMTMFKLLNKYLDSNYNFLFEDDLDIKKINQGIVNSQLKPDNFQNDIISKIQKPLQKICNIEYNENYYNTHYKKCIQTDMLNIIRLYTDINKKSIDIEEMKNIELENLKFTHFHVNYGSGLKFYNLYNFNKLDYYLIDYFKNIDVIPNSVIMINICKFDNELSYFIVEYKPNFEIKTLYDYYCFIYKVHNDDKELNYNYSINSLNEVRLSENNNKIYKYGYEIELEYPYCFIRKDNKELKIYHEDFELTIKYPTKITHNEKYAMIKLLQASGLKRIIKAFCKTFLNITLNEKNNKLVNQEDPDIHSFILKNNDNHWIVPNPDNIVFK